MFGFEIASVIEDIFLRSAIAIMRQLCFHALAASGDNGGVLTRRRGNLKGAARCHLESGLHRPAPGSSA